jgi:hypothetical protein
VREEEGEGGEGEGEEEEKGGGHRRGSIQKRGGDGFSRRGYHKGW